MNTLESINAVTETLIYEIVLEKYQNNKIGQTKICMIMLPEFDLINQFTKHRQVSMDFQIKVIQSKSLRAFHNLLNLIVAQQKYQHTFDKKKVSTKSMLTDFLINENYIIEESSNPD